jgi:YD repeat-containing protein
MFLPGMLCCAYASGQEKTTFDITAPTAVYKPSANASEMVKIADVPVSAYSGAARINFPLFSIKSGQLTHDISLNYTGGAGIPVDQEGNWVGLGWDLSLGGVISRSAIGKNDETTTTPGYTTAARQTNLPLWTDANPTNWLNTITTCDKKNMGEGRMDMAPDMYFLNFAGYSARMFFDKNGAVFLSPYKAWKVSLHATSGFTVIVENGTRYEFNTIEHSSASAETYPDDGTSISAGKSAWFLTRIVSANRRDSISFLYTPVTYTYEDGIPSYTVYDLIDGQNAVPCPGGGRMDAHRESYTRYFQTINTHVLNAIVYNGGKIQFTISADRQDINSGNKYRVSAMDIYSAAGIGFSLYKRITFNQTYTNSTATDPLKKRMLLSSFYETSGADTLKHVFTYITPEGLPSKQSFSQDHWGYYNGRNNSTLVPAYDTREGKILPGADREPDSVNMQKGLLKTVTYPTGGTATFDYEPHRYSYYNAKYEYAPRRTDSAVVNTTVMANTVSIGSSPARGADTAEIIVRSIPGQETTVTYYVAGKITGDALAEVFIYDASWNLKASAGDSRGKTLTLPFVFNRGQKYYLVARRDLATEQARISVSYKQYNYFTAPAVYSKMAGGNRIKRITLYDGISHNNDIIKRYKYMLNDSISSGILLDYPKYEDVTYTAYYCTLSTSGGDGQSYKDGDVSYFTRYATSLNALGRTQGSPVGYSKISILHGENGENGREDLFYSITGLYDEGGNGYPYAPKASKEDLRGLLLAHKVYNAAGNVLRATNNEYNFNTTPGAPHYKWIWGAKTGIRKSDAYPATTCPELSHWSFISTMYKVYQFWPVLIAKTDTAYDSNGSALLSKTTYQYNPATLQMINETSTNSDLSVLSKTYKYPDSFAGTAVYDSMVARNMLNEPVETIVTRNNLPVYKEKNNFAFFNGIIAPASKDLANGNNPVENRLQFIRYDADGNLLEQAKSDDVHEVYLWGYRNLYPVARIVGTTYAAVAGLVNASVLYEPASDQALRDEINKVRVALAGSAVQVYTYTYTQQVGVTSETDPAGRTIYYQYDPLKRLATVRDVNGHVIRQFDYEYQLPVGK